jgi:hypothetical protein
MRPQPTHRKARASSPAAALSLHCLCARVLFVCCHPRGPCVPAQHGAASRSLFGCLGRGGQVHVLLLWGVARAARRVCFWVGGYWQCFASRCCRPSVCSVGGRGAPAPRRAAAAKRLPQPAGKVPSVGPLCVGLLSSAPLCHQCNVCAAYTTECHRHTTHTTKQSTTWISGHEFPRPLVPPACPPTRGGALNTVTDSHMHTTQQPLRHSDPRPAAFTSCCWQASCRCCCCCWCARP